MGQEVSAERAVSVHTKDDDEDSDQDEFESWKICWEANLAFFELADGPQTCLVCSTTKTYPPGTYRSTVWTAVRCWSGHGQADFDKCAPDASPGICPKCDQDFLLDVLRGKHHCRREGCRRLVRVNEGVFRKKLADSPIMTEFFGLVDKSKVYECLVHCDDVTFTKDSPPTATCNHDQNVCDDCVRMDFETKVKGNRLKDLKCLDPDCKKDVPGKRIRELISAECVKIYDKKLALNSISKNPKFRWCKCGSGQIHGPGESSPEWKCVNCPRQNCYICKDIDVISCEHLRAINEARKNEKDRQRNAAMAALQKKQREQTENTQATKELLAKTCKICPKKGCGVHIQREDGCAHMTCRNGQCKAEFCWVCKVIWQNKKPLHLTTCSLAVSRKITLAKLDKSDYAEGWQDDPRYDTTQDKNLWLLESHK